MLTGFETITVNLSDEERRVHVPLLINGLREFCVGKANVANNRKLRDAFKAAGHTVGSARLRKLISYIDTHGLLPELVANEKGYYLATTVKEVQDYISSLEGRVAIIQKRAQVKKDLLASVEMDPIKNA
jgi:hypothetical protein